MKNILLFLCTILSVGVNASDTFTSGDPNEGSFYSGNLASREPDTTFYNQIPSNKGTASKTFFDDATKASYTGLSEKVSTRPTKYYLFPMDIQENQHAVFEGTVGRSKRKVVLKDNQLLNLIKRKVPLVSGTLTLYSGKQKLEVLTFKGNAMHIVKYPDDLLPTIQTCPSEVCCLKINLGKDTPGVDTVVDINLSPGACPYVRSAPASAPKPPIKKKTTQKQARPSHPKESFMKELKDHWVNVNN